MKRFAVVLLAVGALMAAGVGAASAHAKIDHCTPALGSTVASAPSQVFCIMSEEIEAKQSTMSVWNASGAQVDKKDAHVDLDDSDHKTLIVSLDQSLMGDGTYTVRYHTATPNDNGITNDAFTFTVANAPAQTAATTTAAATMVGVTGSTGTATPAAPSTVPTTGAALSRSILVDAGLLIAFTLIASGMILQLRRR